MNFQFQQVAELKKECHKRKLRGYSVLKKQELIHVLQTDESFAQDIINNILTKKEKNKQHLLNLQKLQKLKIEKEKKRQEYSFDKELEIAIKESQTDYDNFKEYEEVENKNLNIALNTSKTYEEEKNNDNYCFDERKDYNITDDIVYYQEGFKHHVIFKKHNVNINFFNKLNIEDNFFAYKLKNYIFDINDINCLIKLNLEIDRIMKNIHTQCIICDSKLKNPSFKPYVCDNDLCYYSYTNLNIGFSLQEFIVKKFEVFDLRVSLCYFASSSPSSDEIFNDISNKELNKKLSQFDMNILYTYAKTCASEDDFKYKISPVMYNLYSRIINFSSLLIEKEDVKIETVHITESSQVDKKFETFSIKSSNEKIYDFNSLKENNKSIIAYHGSNICNWIFILKDGLKNLSGTNKQINGAAWGKGIYLGDNTTARLYAHFGEWNKSILFRNKKKIVATCEVCFCGNFNWQKGKCPFYVVENERYVNIKSISLHSY